jgi:hypothetical protein
LFGWISGDMALPDQPADEPANGDEVAVDGRHGLTSIPSLMIAEVSDVTGGDPTDDEPLTIRGDEPSGELPDVLSERSPGVVRQIVAGKELTKQGRFLYPDRNAAENIIATVFHVLSPKSGQQVDMVRCQLG